METFLFTSSISHQQEIFRSILLLSQSVFLKYQFVKIAKNSETTEMYVNGEAHDLIEEISLIQQIKHFLFFVKYWVLLLHRRLRRVWEQHFAGSAQSQSTPSPTYKNNYSIVCSGPLQNYNLKSLPFCSQRTF